MTPAKRAWKVVLADDNDLELTIENSKLVLSQPIVAYKRGEITLSLSEAKRLRNQLHAAIIYLEEAAKPQRIMRIRWSKPEDRAPLNEVYFVQQPKTGKYRRADRLPGNAQVVPGADMLEAWFRRLKITHIEVFDDYHDEMPDGLYPVKKYIAWLRKCEDENE